MEELRTEMAEIKAVLNQVRQAIGELRKESGKGASTRAREKHVRALRVQLYP